MAINPSVLRRRPWAPASGHPTGQHWPRSWDTFFGAPARGDSQLHDSTILHLYSQFDTVASLEGGLGGECLQSRVLMALPAEAGKAGGQCCGAPPVSANGMRSTNSCQHPPPGHTTRGLEAVCGEVPATGKEGSPLLKLCMRVAAELRCATNLGSGPRR